MPGPGEASLAPTATIRRFRSFGPANLPRRGCRGSVRGSARPAGESPRQPPRKGLIACQSSLCGSCWRPASTSVIRRAVGTPRCAAYIFGERGGIYIIDLTKTLELLEESYEFVRNIADRGGTVLFVGTKKQAQDAVKEHATRVGMPYVNHRWLGGLLTNWRTISERITYLHDLRRLKADGQLDLLPSKERIAMEADLVKLEANLGGVADMKRQPDAVFVIDMKKEQLAVRETQRLGVPVIGLVDTNADPDEANFVIPGNDDAIRSCNLVARVLADGIAAGKTKVTAAELVVEEEAEPAVDEAPAEEPAEGEAATDAEPELELEPAAVVAEGGETE